MDTVADPSKIHRLTWRGWHSVYVYANGKTDAIAVAIKMRPAWIPAGTELHYGPVGQCVGLAP